MLSTGIGYRENFEFKKMILLDLKQVCCDFQRNLWIFLSHWPQNNAVIFKVNFELHIAVI